MIGQPVVLVVPAYRPSAVLVDLIDSIRAADRTRQMAAIVVVDDGSGPGFRAIFSQLEGCGVTVLRHAVNLGKGAALKTGFNYALLAFPDMAGIVTADADGQHAVEDILRVARALAETPDQMILGVRAFSGGVPLRSRLGNGITRWVFRVFTGARLTDTQTGLRGWPKASCQESLPIAINGYDFELECLLRTHHGAGGTPVSLRQVPIETIYVDENRSSHFNPIRDSMRIYFVFLRYCGASVMVALIDSLIFYSVHTTTNSLIGGQIAGRAVGTAVAFTLNRTLVFRSDAGVLASLAKYIALVSLMGFVSYVMLNYLHRATGMPPILAKMVAEGALFIGNFTIQRQLIFVRAKLKQAETLPL